jgi:hypothetical protein
MKRNGMSRRALLGNIALLGVAAGPGRALAAEPARSPINRDFSNPYLELIRLLKEAAEIEHDLMVQYLYCAFSLKPAYTDWSEIRCPIRLHSWASSSRRCSTLER